MWIFSRGNSVLNPEKSKIHHDENFPLNYYFCNSSHNTYLIEHQLYGTPTFEGYERALEQGCRCLEIDCWDGKVEPVVTHGRTFCTNLSFEDLIRDMQPLAFKYSEYPLVLSLEMHCSRPKRDMIANVLKKYFPTELYYLTKEDFFSNKLPLLKDLKRKVLIKCKSKYPTFVLNKIGETGKVPVQNEVNEI